MPRRSDPFQEERPDWDRMRERFIGLDESFSVKSYYPQLKARLKDLEEERRRVQESEARLQAVFRNLPFAFWSADVQGVVLLANDTARRRYGMEQGRMLDNLPIPDDSSTALLADFSAALSGRTERHERALEENGSTLWIQSTVAPILVEGSVVGVLGTDVDVTMLKKAEELREAQDRLLLAEKLAVISRLAASIAHELNSPLGAIESSSATLMDGIPKAARQFSGFLPSLSGEALSRFQLFLSKALDRAVDFSDGGNRRHRRELAQRFASLGVESPEYLAELTDEISGYEALDELLGRFGTETATTMIKTAADCAVLVRSASIIRHAAERAAAVVNAVRNLEATGESLPFSIDQEQKASGGPAGVDVDASLAAAVELFRGKISREVKVVERLQSRNRVLGDAAALGLVWINLISNALQAMEYRGILEVGSRVEAGAVVVEIVDSGCGIPESDWGRVFDPFFTTKSLGEGTGFGLVAAKRNVERAGGTISFESRPGRTVFRVILPIAESRGGTA